MNFKEEAFYRWVGAAVASRRKEKKLTQTELAEMLGLSRASIANIEKGRQCPPLFNIWTIAENWDVKPEDLLPLSNEHLPPDDEKLLTEVKKTGVKDTSSIADFLKSI